MRRVRLGEDGIRRKMGEEGEGGEICDEEGGG